MQLDAVGKARNVQIVDIAGPAKRVDLEISPLNLAGMTTYVKA
jgi:hypothetical protein